MANFNMEKLIILDKSDNICIVRQKIFENEEIVINGTPISFQKEIAIGHKIALKDIAKGEKILKNGVPIGSAKSNIKKGEHVHLHNLGSDYLPTYTIENAY